MLPLCLNVTGRRCLVVGGGPVGRRKAAVLQAAGAAVCLVCLEPPPADAAPIEWRQEPYRPDHLDGCQLACAAATPEVNGRVAADARRRGLWVNVADDPAGSDFHLPAVLRRGDFLVAVSTGGASPALARRLRDGLAGTFDEAYGQWAALLAELRPLVTALPEARRAGVLAWLTDPAWPDRLRTEGPETVRRAMRAGLADRAGEPGTSVSGGVPLTRATSRD
jgi:precorrin-2 dehydrogenase/sirohydrochlorin ferrochelatase